jgi:hypothetical protein
MKFAGGSGCGEVLWLLSYREEVEGRTSSFWGRNVVLRVWKITHELTRFRVLVILFPYLSTAFEQIRALQTRCNRTDRINHVIRAFHGQHVHTAWECPFSSDCYAPFHMRYTSVTLSLTWILTLIFYQYEPGSSVSVVSRCGLDDRAIEIRSPAEAKGLFL